jgi:hypothetical protein
LNVRIGRGQHRHTTSFQLAGSPHDLDRPAIGGGKDNFGAPNMLLILRPTAMPRTARSAALLDMSASTDSGRTPQAGGQIDSWMTFFQRWRCATSRSTTRSSTGILGV